MIRPRSSAPATAFAVALLEECVRLGVRDVVLSPGSRSQAIALAAAEFEAAGLIRLRVRIDERVGGFLAIGLAVETGRPVLVVTTSGTAVANLHPAVLEAHHSAVPLIVITADRPHELRGIASNQTTHQSGIFGLAVRASWDIDAPTAETSQTDAAAAIARVAVAAAAGTAAGAIAGPVHLNIGFREPLSGPIEFVEMGPAETNTVETNNADARPVASPVADSAGVGAGAAARDAMRIVPGVGEPRTVVIAGAGAGERAEEVARQLGAPLLAEVSSGAHFGPNLVVAYRELLGEAGFGDLIERAIVFGHPTLSREVPALIQRDGVETIVVRSGPEGYNPGHRVAGFTDALDVVGEPDRTADGRAWLGRWVTTSRALLERQTAPDIEIAISGKPADQAAFSRAVLAGLREPITRRTLVEAVWRMTWPHDRLVLGASRLIREADRVVPGKRIRVHANRGLAGIDGTVSTAIGIALASQAEPGSTSGGVTRVLLGDLTLLHDAGALLFGTGESRPRVQVIVGNDGGGTIFDALEVATTAAPAVFDRVLLTSHTASLEHLAAAYGWHYRRAVNRGDLDAALTPSDTPTLIEVPLSR